MRMGRKFGWSSTKRLLRSALLTTSLLALLPATASAASALIVEPQLEGELAANDPANLRKAAEAALKSQQLGLIPAADLDATLSGEAQLQGCHTELCYERMGRLLDSQLVLRYRIKRSGPAGSGAAPWRLAVEILDVEVGAFGSKLAEDCASCTDKQATEKLEDMVKRAVVGCVAKPRGTLDVRSEPSGAAVFVDGTELGITPYKRTTFVGTHKVVLRHIGFRSEQLDAEVVDGQRQKIERKLTVGSDPTTGPMEKTPVYKKWWFWVAIGGAAAVAAGVTAGVVLGTRSAGTNSVDRTPPNNTLVFTF